MRPEAQPASPDRALDAYAAQAAHQLGEAVALLRASATLLERRCGSDPQARDGLRGLGAGVERAQRFVDDLLELNAVTASDLDPVDVDVAAIVGGVGEELAEPLARCRAVLVAEGEPVVHADRRQVRRLVLHLTRVALASGATTVRVSVAPAEGGTALAVTDDGLPFAGDDDPFAPFARGRGRGPLVGAGISLPLCRRIAERHGAAIGLTQDGATGTAVAVTFPEGAS